jgi:inhibitor of growth protein 3
MPVARGTSHPALAITGSTAITSSKLNSGDAQVATAAADGGVAEGGEAEGDGDDKTYCFCDGVSYGEMIACDELDCEREWVRPINLSEINYHSLFCL